MPRVPPLNESQPRYSNAPRVITIPPQKDFWRSSHPFAQPPDSRLGDEILAALRSTTGGIYYTKSTPFNQVHYIDQHPIYSCAFVPSHLIPRYHRKPRSTELGRGMIRREALDLLGYSYTRSETGNFSISADLELVCERFQSDDLGLRADFCLKRVTLKSLSNFHTRPSKKTRKSVQRQSSRKEAGVKLSML